MIISKIKLEESEIESIKALNKLCEINKIPNFDTSFYIDPNLKSFYLKYNGDKLIGYLCLFYVRINQIDVSCVIHPSYRKQGNFTKLLEQAKKMIPDNIELVFEIPSKFVKKRKLESKGLIYKRGEEEFINKKINSSDKSLIIMQEKDLIEVANIVAISFNKGIKEEIKNLKNMVIQKDTIPYILKEQNTIIGFVAIASNCYSGTQSIFSLCVNPKYRGKGYAKKIINCLPVNKEGYILKVYIENLIAKKLYMKLGFNLVSSSEYYTKKILSL